MCIYPSLVVLSLSKEERNDIVGSDDTFVTISGFPLQLYKVLFYIILYEDKLPLTDHGLADD
jgi:hypothetical protein